MGAKHSAMAHISVKECQIPKEIIVYSISNKRSDRHHANRSFLRIQYFRNEFLTDKTLVNEALVYAYVEGNKIKKFDLKK